MSEQQKFLNRLKAVDKLLTDPFDEKLIRMYLAEAMIGCETGDHDPVPILGYENAVIGEQCRQCGKVL